MEECRILRLLQLKTVQCMSEKLTLPPHLYFRLFLRLEICALFYKLCTLYIGSLPMPHILDYVFTKIHSIFYCTEAHL